MERTRRSHPHFGEEEIREGDDRLGMAQFDFFEQQSVPPPGTGQFSDAAPPPLPDLNLSLSSGGQVCSNSLPASLAINERAPPPPRDFLSLSSSGAVPTGSVPHQQQVPLLEYQNRRIDESSQRRLPGQTTARERPTLPSPQQHPSMSLIQKQAREGRPMQQQQQQSRQVVFPTKILPQQQVSTGQHHQQQAMAVLPQPVQQQNQHRVSAGSASQGAQPSSVAAEITTVLKTRAFSRAINYIRTALSSGTINMAAEEGSSNCTSALMDSALADRDVNRGKQPLVPRSETAPTLNISSSGSGGTVPVEVPSPESMGKRMRPKRVKGLEDGVQKVMSKMLGEAFKVGRDVEERMTEGFLYRHRTGEVSIVCSCHGIFLTSAEFLQHASKADVENPRKRITVSSNPIPDF